jgi:hypothetical protein
MNLRKWTKDHTFGILIGIATSIICSFIVVGILAWKDGFSYGEMFSRFTFYNVMKAKVLSLASIGSLFWFHRFLKKEKWSLAMGVILATILNLIIILYYRFI